VTYKLHLRMLGFLELRRYRTPDGKVPVSEWLSDLDNKTAARILAYVDRMKNENFGNSRSVGQGVSELKINFGSGYRVYYLRDGKSLVVLLCGGDKGSQKADISQSHQCALDYWSYR